jgi:flagellar biosynthesis protein FlhA
MAALQPNQIARKLLQSEVFLAIGVLFIIALLFVPLPAWLLDVMFSISITMAVLILLNVLFIEKATDFNAFPTLLLITTLLRLSLNVASTRLIITHGHQDQAAAGKIIEAFGQFVIGGEFLVGIVIFLIYVVFNFIVITKGATRIAEVAARFTLDSLPGKQMAIDADLNAGLITEDDARARRKELEYESGFYGAMDGSSKFVRGDAIAGLIITAINILAGIGAGMMIHGMTFAEAGKRFTVLTVGDGLVAMVPALIISLAAGFLVSKSGANRSVGKVILEQASRHPQTMFLAAGLLMLISALPFIPALPFLTLAALLVAGGVLLMQTAHKNAERAAQEKEEQEAAATAQEPTEEPLSSILHIDTLRLELGYGLLSLIDEAKGGRLPDQIKAMRRQMAKEIGFVVPSIRIQDNMQLDPGGYSLSIKDIQVGQGVLRPGKLLAMDPTGAAPPMKGEDTKEPTFGLPAKWIDETLKEEASFNGYTVVDCSTVIVTHLTEVIKDNMADLLTRQEVEKLLEEIKPTYGKLIDELIPSTITVNVLQKVMQNLLSERISVRDLPTILEAIADAATTSKNISVITELVRARMNRQISASHLNEEGIIPIITLSSGWEKEFATSITVDGGDRQLAMEPTKVQAFIRAVKDSFEKQIMSGMQPVLLTSPGTRPFVRSLLERTLPTVPVLSQSEIHPKVKIRTVGSV